VLSTIEMCDSSPKLETRALRLGVGILKVVAGDVEDCKEVVQ
jgi:hypothetical protein